MELYDEDMAVEEIKRIPLDARLHLSHVVRNGMCVIIANYKLGGDVEKAVLELEKRWGEFGL